MILVATTAAVGLLIVAIGIAVLEPKARDESVNRLPFALFEYEADNLTLAVDATGSTDPDGTIANYTWDFGDGTAGYGMTAVHEYGEDGTYTVKLNLTDNLDGTNSTSKEVSVSMVIEVESDPVAVIQVVSNENGTVVLSASGSSDPDGGGIASYAWSFSDGSAAEGESATHTFVANGTYTVTLTVVDDDGADGEASVELEVTIEWVSPPEPPVKEKGPPGLLHAIENHEDKVEEKPQLQNSLDHLLENLDRWLEKHGDKR
jgi:PKD repeat protein